MKVFKYIIVFVIVFLIFKAFFLDSYLEKKRLSESNASVETTQEESASVEEEFNVSGMAAEKKEKKEKQKKKNEGMPIDELGDSIAEKLEDKL
jgi:Flp pilus assembly protein TadB